MNTRIRIAYALLILSNTPAMAHDHEHPERVVVEKDYPPASFDYGTVTPAPIGQTTVRDWDRKVSPEAVAAWTARCQPSKWVDHEGVTRWRYALPDCDLTTP